MSHVTLIVIAHTSYEGRRAGRKNLTGRLLGWRPAKLALRLVVVRSDHRRQHRVDQLGGHATKRSRNDHRVAAWVAKTFLGRLPG